MLEAILDSLFEEHPHLPYARYGAMESGLRVAYAKESLRRAAAAPGAETLVTGPQGRHGVAILAPTPWDSGLLETAAGRVSGFEIAGPLHGDRDAHLIAARALARDVAARADARDLRYVTARVPAGDTVAAIALQEVGFQVVDGILTFSRDLEDPLPQRSEAVPVRDADPSDEAPLRALAESAFVYDRFHNDPVVPTGIADRVHGEWVTNAIHGRYGCATLVADVDGKPAGFFVLAEDTLVRETTGLGVGILVLIAVDPAARRRGVARALSVGSLHRFLERGNRYAEVGTQLANLPASNVYLDAGFRLSGTQVTLRRTRVAV